MNRIIASFFLLCLSALAFAQVKVFTPKLTFFPEKDTGRIARMVFEPAEKGSFFVTIRDAKGQVVRCLTTGLREAGQISVDWDGKDSAGAVVPVGTYTASLSSGIGWELDRTFGKDGRIGRLTASMAVDDPEKMQLALQGEVISVKVNDAEYYRADDLSIAGPNYMVKDGTLRVNPTGGAAKGDTLTVSCYYPTLFDNPWDLSIGDDGSLFVLLRPQDPKKKSFSGRLLKLTPDGKGLDQDYGNGGQLPPTNGAQQVLLVPAEKRLYLAGSHQDGHQTGVFSLDTGAFLYAIGGWGGEQRTTPWPAGICAGAGNTLYIDGGTENAFTMYDRSKEKFEGFLAASAPNQRHGLLPPLIHNYWGPTLERAPEEDMFYLTTYGSDIIKVKDKAQALTETYFAQVDGQPVGVSLDRATRLLYAALRTKAGEVAVLSDDGMSLKEVARLQDADLGPTHTVRFRDGYLYVIEDNLAPTSLPLEAMKQANIPPEGRSRLSRYRVTFGKETAISTIERK